MILSVPLDFDEAELWSRLSSHYELRPGFSTRALVAAALHFFSLSEGKLEESRNSMTALRESILAMHSKTRGVKLRGFEAREQYGVLRDHVLQQVVGTMEEPKVKPFRDVLLKCTNESCKLLVAKGMFATPDVPACPAADPLELFKAKYGARTSSGDLDRSDGMRPLRDDPEAEAEAGPDAGGAVLRLHQQRVLDGSLAERREQAPGADDPRPDCNPQKPQHTEE